MKTFHYSEYILIVNFSQSGSFSNFLNHNFNFNVLTSDYKRIYKCFHKSAEVMTMRSKFVALKYIFMFMMKCLLLTE
jgi:hypothetical protein